MVQGGRQRLLGGQKPKAEFLWVSPPPPQAVSPVKSAFGSFQGFPEADRAGGAGRSTMGDFKIHKYYAVSSWFGSHTKAGGASQNVNFDHNIGR